ncbi:MAG: THxN family PEP-CTERM protein [Anaerolineaceae bacterium]
MTNTFLAAVVIAVSTTFGVQASTVDLTGVTGTWGTPTGGFNVNHINNGSVNAGVRWGTGANQSGYDFKAAPLISNIVPDQEFTIGNFTHHNFPITAGTSITAVDLVVNYTLDFAFGSRDFSSRFSFDHWETPNEPSICADGGRNGAGVNVAGCADRVKITTDLSSDVVTFVDEDGTEHEYVLHITGFLDGKGNPVSEFWTVEGKTNTASLQGVFTHKANIAPIPLPAAGFLLLGAIGGLGLVARRRRK